MNTGDRKRTAVEALTDLAKWVARMWWLVAIVAVFAIFLVLGGTVVVLDYLSAVREVKRPRGDALKQPARLPGDDRQLGP
jgi:hypothetical protein